MFLRSMQKSFFLFLLLFAFASGIDLTAAPKTLRSVLKASRFLEDADRTNVITSTQIMIRDLSDVIEASAPLIPQARDGHCVPQDAECFSQTDCCFGVCSLVGFAPFRFVCTACEDCPGTFNNDCPDLDDPICQGITTRPSTSQPTNEPVETACKEQNTQCENVGGVGECCGELGCYLTINTDNPEFNFPFIPRCLPCEECAELLNQGICPSDCDNITVPPTRSPSTTPSQEPSTFPSLPPTTEEPSLFPTSSVPTVGPTDNPTTDQPSLSPTSDQPSLFPTSDNPTINPSSEEPSTSPSLPPSTNYPSVSPTSDEPSVRPTQSPSFSCPTHNPTHSPSAQEPTVSPSTSPSCSPSNSPSTEEPSVSPSTGPTRAPYPGTQSPTIPAPSWSPTSSTPSVSPSVEPSFSPSQSPITSDPSTSPSVDPTQSPTTDTPSNSPTSSVPSTSPSLSPSSEEPSTSPSNGPSTSPSADPTTTPSTSPSTTPTSCPTTDSPSQSPTSDTPSVSPSHPPTSSEPSVSPSFAPTTESPSVSPSRNPTSDTPTRTPSAAPTADTPTTSPSQNPTTDTPSNSPTFSSPTNFPTSSEPSTNPTTSPSKNPVTSIPSTSPTYMPTLICEPGTYGDVGSDAIQLDTSSSSLVGDTLTLVTKWPAWMNVTTISFQGASGEDLNWSGEEGSDFWQGSVQNNCQDKAKGTFDWNEIYGNNLFEWTVRTDDDGTYLSNTMTLELEQFVTARGQVFKRIYTYDILWMLSLPTSVDVSFDLVDIYANQYYTQAQPLCEKVDRDAQVVFVLEHSRFISPAEFDRIRDTWAQTVEDQATDTMKLGTVTFGDWISSDGTVLDQSIEDFLNLASYVNGVRGLTYEAGSAASTKEALQLAIDTVDEFNTSPNAENGIILVTYSKPVDISDPTSNDPADPDIDDLCTLLDGLVDKQISLGVIALTDRVDWTIEELQSTFGCLTNQILPQANMDDLIATLENPNVISRYNCTTQGDLCTDSAWAEPLAIETTFNGDNGALTWTSDDEAGSIYWDATNGWTIDGYANLVISNDATGPVPVNAVTNVETWYIVPCSTNVPEEWEYFRIGVTGYSVCRIGDQAGFENPTPTTVTVGNVPNEYVVQIGTVSAINVDDDRLGCSATTVRYDDGVEFNYCYDEIRCSDWVNRCENDCTQCVAYDNSGSSDNLVSEFNWRALPAESLGTCSFGTNTGTCGAEVGETGAAVFRQCVGSKRTVTLRRRRKLSKVNVNQEIPVRRELNAWCHAVWGKWSDCSKTCGHGFEFRTYTVFSDPENDCSWKHGEKEFRQCELVPCPRLQDVITHDAHFIPDINAHESTMHLHFTTSLNGPWQFEGHGLTITDLDGAVDTGSISVTKVNENCNGVQNCVQEWRMNYITKGVCDPDGMHKLELTPYSAFMTDEPLQVTIALLSHGCGQVDENERNGVDNIQPITPFDAEPSHTMTVTMPVRQPRSPSHMNHQITELLEIISSNIGNVEVQEVSRLYQTEMGLEFDHSGSDSEVLFEFFDEIPIGVGNVLGIPTSSVKDFQVGSAVDSTHMVVSLTASLSDETKSSEVFVLLTDSPDAFTSALTLDLQNQASWLDESIVLDRLEDMKVSVTVQAKATSNIDLDSLVRKLEALGYQVVIHDEFGQKTNVIPLSPSQTVTIQQTQTTSTSESQVWQILFGFICVLLASIIFAVCYKRANDKKHQKAAKATKLYEYEIRKNAKGTTKQTEKDHWDHQGDPTHIPYHNTAKN